MILSFRTRLFLSSTAIVALALALVLSIGWSRVMDFELERLNTSLCNEARRLAMEPAQTQELARLEKDILSKLHLETAEQLLLRVDSPQQHQQSAQWAQAQELATLAWPATHARERVEPAENDGNGERLSSRSRPRLHGEPSDAGCALASFTYQGEQWRAARSVNDETSSIVAADLSGPSAEIHVALRSALMVELPLALLLTAFGALALAALSLRPVNRLRESMQAVTPLALGQRLSDAGEDREFRELIQSYNTMLERLERSFQQASRFSADAAHELKTPLTILRGRMEQWRRKTSDAATQDELAELLDEVGRLSAITRKLLLLSQADAGKLELTLSDVDLTELLGELVADARMLAEGKPLVSSIQPDLQVSGDFVLLRQLLNNLFSNALRYSSPGSQIEVYARRNGSATIEIGVKNTNPPVAAAERARFFERFYRGDSARNRVMDGSGLGLSLAREIARAHHGELVLLESPLEQTHLKLVLPAA
ncbi:MAG: ATP-binding protein [Rhodoferax sp.]